MFRVNPKSLKEKWHTLHSSRVDSLRTGVDPFRKAKKVKKLYQSLSQLLQYSSRLHNSAKSTPRLLEMSPHRLEGITYTFLTIGKKPKCP